jgi:hypothetical protein
MDMTPSECVLVLKGSDERKREEYYLNYACMVNAIGSCLSNKFTPKHPFEEEETPIDKARKKEELLAEYESLMNEDW